jgi:hypothetical protein
VGHVVEPATSGRSKCRACGEHIAKGVMRLGERLPNLFGEGDMTQWFHPACAAYKRPQLFLEAAQAGAVGIDDNGVLESVARVGVTYRRLPRINGVERAPTARSHCRHCRELIQKDAWRIALVYFEEGYFSPGGFIHLSCAPAYFETTDLLDRLRHFSPNLTDSDVEQLRAQLG